MSRYIGFKLEPGQQIPKWYFSKDRPEDPHILIDVKTLWSNVSQEEDHYILLNVLDGRINGVSLVTSDHVIDDESLYIRLFDLIRDRTGDLPTQPMDNE